MVFLLFLNFPTNFYVRNQIQVNSTDYASIMNLFIQNFNQGRQIFLKILKRIAYIDILHLVKLGGHIMRKKPTISNLIWVATLDINNKKFV